MQNMHAIEPTTPTIMDTMSPPNSDDSTAKKQASVSQQILSLPQTEKLEVNNTKETKGDTNAIQQPRNCSNDGHNSRNCSAVGLDSPVEECEEDTTSHSSKDSGRGKSSGDEGSLRHGKFKSNRLSSSSSQLNFDSTLFWGATLLYYTGIPSPTVKEHHFSSTPPSPLFRPSSPRERSFFGRKFRSHRHKPRSLSFSANDMERANSPLNNYEHGIPTGKSPSEDSGEGSSILTNTSTGFVATGENNEMSDRKRNESCGSSSTDSNRTGLRSRIKNTASSLRLLKGTRPGLDSFMDKTQSLPRPPRRRRICEEAVLTTASCATVVANKGDSPPLTLNLQDSSELEASTNKTKLKSSSSTFGSARKALRDSFKAARSLLPSSSKISLSGKTSFKTDDNDRENVKAEVKQHHQRSRSYDDNDGLSKTNTSTPNTPIIIKKSKLEKARKRFASTLSLHTGGSGSCVGSGGSSHSHRSKSASTLVITDSELIPSAHHESSFHRDSLSASTDDMLAVEEKIMMNSSSSKWNNDKGMTIATKMASKEKAESSGRKSAFSFIRKAKGRLPEGEAFEGLEMNEKLPMPIQSKSSKIPSDITKKGTTVEEEEKPSKKRTSFVKSIGQAIRSGKASKKAIKEQSVQFDVSQSTSAQAHLDEASKGKVSGKAQEIVILDKEPRIRTPKSSRKEIALNIGGPINESTTGGSATYTKTPSTEQEEFGEEKDREIQELEAAETSIDFSPRKLFRLSQPVTKTNESWDDAVVQPNDSNAATLGEADISNIFDTLDFSRSTISRPTHLSLPEGEGGTVGRSERSRSGITRSDKTNERQSKVKIKKKGKSQSLITSLVFSTAPSKKETSNNIAMDDSKKSKKSSKKAGKKNASNGLVHEGTKSMEKVATLSSSPANSPSTEEDELVNTLNDNGNNINDGRKIETEKLVGKSYSDVLTSGTSLVDPSSPSNRNSSRKSSDESKELRKNAVHQEEMLPLADIDGGDKQGHDMNGKNESNSQQEILLESQLDLDEDEGASSPSNTNLYGDGGGGSRSQSKSSLSDSIGIVQDQTNPHSCSSNNNTVENGMGASITKMSDSSFKNVASPVNAYECFADMRRRESEAGSRKGDETETDPETACTESFRQLKPFNYDLEPVEEGKKERLYKVLVVGELGAGKTSIIKRYVHQFFSQHYRATIGVDFALKVLRWDPDTVVRLQLWDIAGQERFGSMTRVYYKEAVGAFIVFDVTRSATLEAVPKWKADLDAKVALPDGRPIPTVLLANKSDQQKEGIAANREKMNEFCQQQGFSAWFETSAKDNINIDESANFLVSKILEMDKWSQEPLAPDPDKLDLTANGKHNKGSPSSNCAC